MRRSKITGFLLGVCITTILFTNPWIDASTLRKNIEVVYTTMPVYINGEEVTFKKAPFLFKNWTYVSMRELLEKIGKVVYYDPTNQSIHVFEEGEEPWEAQKEFTFQNLTIGYQEATVRKTLGEADRIDVSKYGFQWHIYNKDYRKYIQVGIEKGRIVGFYSNADFWRSKKGVGIGTPRDVVHQIYGEPLKFIQKGDIKYVVNGESKGYDVYLIEDYYVTLFYSTQDLMTVTGIQVVEKNVEEGLQQLYGKNSDQLARSYERQIFDMVNTLRVRKEMKTIEWDQTATLLAREHSEDMGLNDYFSHNDLQEKSPFKRFEEKGLESTSVAENIAAGYTSAVFAFEGWVNSVDHLEKMLGDFDKAGIGVYLGGKYKIYFTQDFYKTKKEIEKAE